jgi:hypothetical protein
MSNIREGQINFTKKKKKKKLTFTLLGSMILNHQLNEKVKIKKKKKKKKPKKEKANKKNPTNTKMAEAINGNKSSCEPSISI